MRVCMEWARESFRACRAHRSPATRVVCLVATVLVVVLCVVWSILQLVLIPATFLMEMVLSIPIVGRLINQLLCVAQEIVWRIVAIPDALLCVIGFRPLKKVRLRVVILRDEHGSPTTTEATLDVFIRDTSNILRDAAKVHVILERIHTVWRPSPSGALDVSCGVSAWGEDIRMAGAYFRRTMAITSLTGSASRILGYGAVITAFAVRSIPGSTAGCSLGPLTNYFTIDGANPLCFAHELGHAVGLWHCCPPANLANHRCGGTELRWWQRAIVRSSRFVRYV